LPLSFYTIGFHGGDGLDIGPGEDGETVAYAICVLNGRSPQQVEALVLECPVSAPAAALELPLEE